MGALLENILVGVLSAYLAGTNSLALAIEGWLLSVPEEAPMAVEENVAFTVFPEWFTPAEVSEEIEEDNVEELSPASVPTEDFSLEPIVWTDTIVNIYCQYFTPGQVRSMSGTGFFASSDGAILTNAHVAQFLLLEYLDQGDARCFVGTGETSTATFEVDLLYISPTWILENSELIATRTPRGNGANDFAILYVTGSLDGESVPDNIPYLAVDTGLLKKDVAADIVSIAGYPASTGDDELKGTQRHTATTTVARLYTLGTNYADILSLLGSSLGERGVSGGPVVNEAGKVIGLITTLGNDEIQGAGSLNAITISYINRSILKETGYDLTANINGDLEVRANIFKNTLVPWLAKELGEALE